jgi:hypothetical protein
MVDDSVSIFWVSVYKISDNWVGILIVYVFIWSHASGLMRLLTADQKQQNVNICEELHQIASSDAPSLSRVITGAPETKQQSSQ